MEARIVRAGEESGDRRWPAQRDACGMREGELRGEVVEGGVCVAEAVEEYENRARGSRGRRWGDEEGGCKGGVGGEVRGGR